MFLNNELLKILPSLANLTGNITHGNHGKVGKKDVVAPTRSLGVVEEEGGSGNAAAAGNGALSAPPLPLLHNQLRSSPRLRRYAAVRACFGPSSGPRKEEEEENEGKRRRSRMRRSWRASWWRSRRGRRRRGERPECALTESCTAASQQHLLTRAQPASPSSSSSFSSSASSSSPSQNITRCRRPSTSIDTL